MSVFKVYLSKFPEEVVEFSSRGSLCCCLSELYLRWTLGLPETPPIPRLSKTPFFCLPEPMTADISL